MYPQQLINEPDVSGGAGAEAEGGGGEHSMSLCITLRYYTLKTVTDTIVSRDPLYNLKGYRPGAPTPFQLLTAKSAAKRSVC